MLKKIVKISINMTQVNRNQILRKVGIPTPQTVIYKSESHKLHQAFPAKKTSGVVAEIVPGQPVKLNTDGTIEPYNGSGIYLGIAVTDSQNPCYPEGELGPEVTVMVEAFAVIYGVVATGVSEALSCGYVAPGAKTAGEAYVPYNATAEAAESNFVNITPGSEAGELIQVLVR